MKLIQPQLQTIFRAILFAVLLVNGASSTSVVFAQVPPAPSAPTNEADEEDTQRFMVVLTIGENEARALRRDGVLRATLPKQFHNRVDSVLLKHPTTFRSEKLVVENDVDKSGRTLLVNVDEAIVDRLEYQPVQIKVYQSGYDTIAIKYQRPNRRRSTASIRRPRKPGPQDSKPVFVRLNQQNGTTGWIRNMKSLDVTTEFGNINLPLERVAGIRFNAPGQDDVQIVSRTGDYFSGKIEFEEIVLATRWGDEKLAVNDLESITHHRESRFTEFKAEDEKASASWILSQPAKPVFPNQTRPRFLGYPQVRGLPNRNF